MKVYLFHYQCGSGGTGIRRRNSIIYRNMEWNPNIAYAIGLITTDGNLSKDGRHIIFVSKDASLVRLFKKCLGSRIRSRSKQVAIPTKQVNIILHNLEM